jgi:hypothetical protein
MKARIKSLLDFQLIAQLFSHIYSGDVGTIWNLPNYDGELFTADQEETPFLSMIGGLNGGLQTENFEFPVDSLYEYPDPEQPNISETTSLTAPTPTHISRAQEVNVTQIFHESIDISYVKLSNQGRLSGVNTAGARNNVADEKNWQIMKKLIKIARDVNYTFHNGVYNKAANASTANRTRGMKTVIDSLNVVDAVNAELSKALLDALFLKMWTAGARFQNVVLFMGGIQKQITTEVYTVLPDSRSVGGSNIQQIITDFGNVGIALDKMMDTDRIHAYEMSVLSPVFQPVPEKGVLFYEELAKTGASEKGQLFGQMGLSHGPEFLHGGIKNLATTSEESPS